MVRLRLRRRGRTHRPFYDIVAADARTKRDGKFIERIGYYNPMTQPSTISVDHARAIYWLEVGAQMTNTVRNIFHYDGVLLRRALQRQGRPAEEIEQLVAAHRERVLQRYWRNKEKRAERKRRKAQAAESAQSDAEASAE
ncbi:MAG: 30S ribosomal protein S16 [Bacteroidota bacterium]|nr:30S ribosomal protein S16 [Candidatus Kapabacteria bacterium]MCS7302555.1 30S ribosomal protein S16 [Candidatus Kapabacteria bacterium]MCX7936759.1 30S ribosomal protein S16 [Chlorobiota bacterium]MDW8074197.1 30S ribosomal protein S16 [Bacteroidota bacterium]MDW8271327.1 30S ribosomal protein S16 [Bacteroidota bacterium]